MHIAALVGHDIREGRRSLGTEVAEELLQRNLLGELHGVILYLRDVRERVVLDRIELRRVVVARPVRDGRTRSGNILQVYAPVLPRVGELASERRQIDTPSVGRRVGGRRHVRRYRGRVIVADADGAAGRIGVTRRHAIRTDPVTGDHRHIVRQARVPHGVVVGSEVVFLGERLNVRRLRIIENPVGTEARERIVVLEHEYEHVIEAGHGLA
jgi:hypothetical protein